MLIRKFEPIYANEKSFYGKAQVVENGSITELYSYGTLVATYNSVDNIVKVVDTFSNTTVRHIKEFIRQTTGQVASLSDIRKLID